MIMRGGVYAWTLPPRLEQIREEMKKKKNLPQGKVTSVFLTFFCLLVFYIRRKKRKEELIVLNIFYFFKEKKYFFFF